MGKKGYAYKSMFRSYALMLLFPVLASLVLYYYTYGTVKAQVESHNSDLMVTIQSACDREFEYYQSVLQSIYKNDMVRELLSSKSERPQGNGWKVFRVKETLTDTYGDVLAHASHCRDLFIYVEKTDKVIGSAGAVSLDLYSKSYYTAGETDEFRSFLQEACSGDILHYRPDTGGEYILLIKKLINANGRSAEAVAGIWISTEDLETRINSIGWEYNSDWTILNREKQIFREIDLLGTLEYDLALLDDNRGVWDIDGVRYLVSTKESEVLDLCYALFTLETVISDSANGIRNAHIFSLLIVLVVGIFMAKELMRKHYEPLQKLTGFFTKPEVGSVKNEYEYLEDQISLLVNNHQNIRKDARKKESALHKYILESVLINSAAEHDANEVHEVIYQRFKKGYNLVLLCGILTDYNASNDVDEIASEKELNRFIISNVYAEGIGEKYYLETLELKEQVALIINMESKQEDYSEVLQEIVERLHNIIAENFHFRVYTMEGGLYPGIEGIHQSYLEACDTADFLNYADEIYIRYADIRNLSVSKYDYSFEMEERVINVIRNHEPKLAVSFINSVLDNNFSRKNQSSAEMLTCLLHDIFGTLIKAGEEQGIRNDKLLTMNHINVESPLEDIKRFFQDVVEEICKEERTALDNERVGELSRDILEFIQENYMDPDLNVSQTALHFGITPSYLSALFKKQTGKSIMETIRQERIDHAMKLLAEGMSVADVSVRVGFRERTTFIRSFKRSTGVAPGSMKK